MWNLLSNTDRFTIYRPTSSAASGGTFTNPTYAYDGDVNTYAYCERNGSAVSGTPIDTTFTYSGFTALAKANFTEATVEYKTVVRLTPLATGVLTYLSCMGFVEYSIDSGSNWSPMGADYYSYYLLSGNKVYDTYPASVVTMAAGGVLLTTGSAVVTLSKRINSSLFGTGLGELQLRLRTSTLTSGAYKSKVTSDIYDIKAIVR